MKKFIFICLFIVAAIGVFLCAIMKETIASYFHKKKDYVIIAGLCEKDSTTGKMTYYEIGIAEKEGKDTMYFKVKSFRSMDFEARGSEAVEPVCNIWTPTKLTNIEGKKVAIEWDERIEFENRGYWQ